jgi:thiamine-phosphate pyrophosphorylase
MRGLYAIVDVDTLERRGLDAVRFGEAVLVARPAALQLRDKSGGARRTLGLLRALAPLAREVGVPFFANDRPDLALLAGCDGVHVGQEDVPVALVRAVAPALHVGLSTHTAEDVDDAITMRLDYIAVGPVFATASKLRPDPTLGLEGLAALAARARAALPTTPVVAIGGIGIGSASAVGAVADAAAVIGALVPDEAGPRAYAEVTERARALHAAVVAGGAR